jgi:rhomboid protease GluP
MIFTGGFSMSYFYVLKYRPVTLIVMVICVVNFIRIHSGGYNENDNAVQCGAFFRSSIECGQWYRFLTTGFVHIQVWHFLMNMVALYNLSWLEGYLGEVWFTVILLGSVIAGSAVQYKWSNTFFSVGLSGGLYGLMAAEFVLFIGMGMFSSGAYLSSFLRTLVLNLLINFMPGIAWQAHAGGAVFGAVMGILILLL